MLVLIWSGEIMNSKTATLKLTSADERPMTQREQRQLEACRERQNNRELHIHDRVAATREASLILFGIVPRERY